MGVIRKSGSTVSRRLQCLKIQDEELETEDNDVEAHQLGGKDTERDQLGGKDTEREQLGGRDS